MRTTLQKSLLKKAAGLLLGVAFSVLVLQANADTYTTRINNGSWFSGSTWTLSSTGLQATSAPGANDDVIINGGNTVTVNAHIFCKSLTIDAQQQQSSKLALAGFNLTTESISITEKKGQNSNATLEATSGIIYISKTLTNTGTLSLGTTSTVVFNGTSAQTIPADQTAYGSIVIDNTAGVTLAKTMTINGELTLQPNTKLYSAGFTINAVAGKTLAMGAGSEFILEGSSIFPTSTDFTTRSMASTSVIKFSANNTSVTLPTGEYANLKMGGSTKTLTGPVSITGSLDLAGGSLALDTYTLTLSGVASAILNPSATNYIKVTSGKLLIESIGSTGQPALRRNNILFPIGTATSYTPATINNTGTPQSFSIGVKDGVTMDNGTILSKNVVKKMWDITPAASGANVELTLQWNAGDQAYFGVNDPSNFNNQSCAINHFNSTTGKWDTRPVTFVAASGNGPYTLTRTGITGFSPFAIGDMNSPLPVELVSFNAIKKNSEVALSWETASEKNNAGFEVQVSTDGKNYEALSFVASKNGNSSAAQRYAYSHKTANKEGLVYYRLKQTDLNGDFEYYTAKVVDLGRIASSVSTFPNPFQNRFELNLNSTTAETVQLNVTDLTGKTVYSAAQKVQPGTNTLKVILENQPAGLYLLKATSGSQTYTNRLVKQ